MASSAGGRQIREPLVSGATIHCTRGTVIGLLAGAICIALAGPRALAQGRSRLDVGLDKGFHGRLGSESLDTFRAYSTGVPSGVGRSGTSSPLIPMSMMPSASTPGGVIGTYRVLPRAVMTPDALPPAAVNVGAPTSLSIPGLVIKPGGRQPDVPESSPLPPAGAGNPLPVGVRVEGTGEPGPVVQPGSVISAGRKSSSMQLGASRTPMAAAFDLAEALRGNEQWRRGVELLKRGEFDKAFTEFQVGLAFTPGRPEGDWLIALAQVGLENYANVMLRLSYVLDECPDLFTRPRGATDLLPERVYAARLAALTDRPGVLRKPSTEERLIATWLAIDAGRANLAQSMIGLGQLTGSAAPVAAALQAAVTPAPPAGSPRPTASPAPGGRGTSPAGDAGVLPAVTPAPSPAGMDNLPAESTFGRWLQNDSGRWMGLPIPDTGTAPRGP